MWSAVNASVYEYGKTGRTMELLVDKLNGLFEQNITCFFTERNELRRINSLTKSSIQTFLDHICKYDDEINRMSSDATGDGASTLGAEGSAKHLYRKAV